MANPLAEAGKAAATTQVAITYLASVAYLELLKLWAEVVGTGTQGAANASSFVRKASKVLTLRRRQAAQITVANLRLQSALRTDEVIRLPSFDGTDFVESPSLGTVREDFVSSIERYAPEALKPEPKMPELPRATPRPNGPVRIEYEPYAPDPALAASKRLKERRQRQLELDLEQLEASIEKATEKALQDLAVSNLKRASQDESEEVKEVALREAGKVGWAGTRLLSDRVTATTAQRDSRVIGYIRVHYSFDGEGPCSFCAMMLSRMAVYKSKDSAGGNIGSLSQYHPNCRCQGEAIYDEKELSAPRYEANRFYKKLWEDEISGSEIDVEDSAERKWRRLIDAHNRGHWKPGASDQE